MLKSDIEPSTLYIVVLISPDYLFNAKFDASHFLFAMH